MRARKLKRQPYALLVQGQPGAENNPTLATQRQGWKWIESVIIEIVVVLWVFWCRLNYDTFNRPPALPLGGPSLAPAVHLHPRAAVKTPDFGHPVPGLKVD